MKYRPSMTNAQFMALLDDVEDSYDPTCPRPAPRKGGSAEARVQQMIARGDGQGHVNSDRVIILNMGLGRDSMSMLALLKQGKLMAECHIVRPQDVDAIVFSDPGAEWDHTYMVTKDVEKAAKKMGIPFYWLKKPLDCDWAKYLKDLKPMRVARGGLTSKLKGKDKAAVRRWRLGKQSLPIETKANTGFYHFDPPIIEDYSQDRPSGPMLVGFGDKACTVNHKISPIRRLMNDLSIQKFGLGTRAWGNRVQDGTRVPHLNLVGIAADEASRASKRNPYNPERSGELGPYWVDEAYPLMEAGIAKSDEQAILDSEGWGHVRKSGCFMCPYQPLDWYWLLGHKAAQGNQWATTALDRLIRAQQRTFQHGKAKRAAGERTPSGLLYPIYVRIMDRRIQGDRMIPMEDREGRRTRPRRTKGGEDMLLLPQAIPVIGEKLVEPRIRRYMDQGMSRKRATEKVSAEILKKDYAQGCKDGSVNRHARQRLGSPRALKAWSAKCPGCGGAHG